MASVGSISGRFEVPYLESDETAVQEQRDYVEDQLQTAVANFRRFCSDFTLAIFPAISGDSTEREDFPLWLEQIVKRNRFCDVNEGDAPNKPTESLNLEMNSIVRESSRTKSISVSEVTKGFSFLTGSSTVSSLHTGVSGLTSENFENQVDGITPRSTQECKVYSLAENTRVSSDGPTPCISGTCSSQRTNSSGCKLLEPKDTDSISYDFEILDGLEEPEAPLSDALSANALNGSALGSCHVIESCSNFNHLISDIMLDESCILVDCPEICSVIDLQTEYFSSKAITNCHYHPEANQEDRNKYQQIAHQDVHVSEHQPIADYGIGSLPGADSNNFCEPDWEII